MIKNFITSNKYLLLILTYVSAIYLTAVEPANSFAAGGIDHFDFMLAAEYHQAPHSTGTPLIAVIEWGWASLAHLFNIDVAWLLALTTSTIPTIIDGLLVYLIIKELIKKDDTKWLRDSYKKWAPYIGMLTLYGSYLILSQTFIVENYTFSLMVVLIATYFTVTNKWKTASLFIGLSFATHGLIWTIAAFLWLVNWKKLWKYIPIVAFFGLTPYIYLYWTQSTTPVAFQTTFYGNTLKDFKQYIIYGFSGGWFGSLAILDIPTRLWDIISIFAVSLGLGGLSLLLILRYEIKKYWWILFIIGIPTYYFVGTAPNIVLLHHALIVVPFLAVLIGLGIKYSKIHPIYYAIVSLLLIGTIPFFWNIGVNLDPNLQAQKLYNNFSNWNNHDIIINLTLQKDKKDAINGTAYWWAALLYDRKNNTKIISIYPNRYYDYGTITDGRLRSEIYKESLHNYFGLKTPVTVIKSVGKSEYSLKKQWYTPENQLVKYSGLCQWNCPQPYLNIAQFQLWYFIDRLQLANPKYRIHLYKNIGTKSFTLKDILYNRTQIPQPMRTEIIKLNKGL